MKDAQGNEHSPENGQFVSQGGSNSRSKINEAKQKVKTILEREEAGNRLRTALEKLDRADKPIIKIKEKGEIKNPIYTSILGDKLKSDKFVLTKKAEEHILEKHANEYNRYGNRISEIINSPDAVFAGNNKPNKPERLAIVKKIDNRLTVVLELSTKSVKANQVVTFYTVSAKQYNNRLKTWKVLYKK